MDFSTLKSVLMSAPLPYPAEEAPAMKETAPFSCLFFASLEARTAVPSLRRRRIGRLEAERKTHFQSSSSPEEFDVANWMASKSVVRVRLTVVLPPAFSPTCSFHWLKKVGAVTRIV